LITLLKEKNQTFRKANEALSKRRRVKRTYLQANRSFNPEEARILIVQKRDSDVETTKNIEREK